jgi:hypothetical protein
LGNYLLKVAGINKELSKRIESVVLVPFTEFANNMIGTNYEKLEKCHRVSKLCLK